MHDTKDEPPSESVRRKNIKKSAVGAPTKPVTGTSAPELISGTDIELLPEWRQLLREQMKLKRYSDRALSIAVGLNAAAVNEWFRKNKTPSLASLRLVARELQVSAEIFVKSNSPLPTDADTEQGDATVSAPSKKSHTPPLASKTLTYAKVLGYLRAGAWQESGVQELEELIHVPSIPHPEYAGLKQYAWRVEGTSMNRVVKAGSYVIGVAFADMPRRIQHRDLVVCQRRDHDRYEYTLKRVAITDVGIRLDPESDDPAWQDPVWLSSGETGGVEVEATHLIIGTFSFLV